MLIVFVLIGSIICQIFALAMSLRLIRLTGRYIAWMLITAALLVMIVRRSVPLFHILAGDAGYSADLVNELIGFGHDRPPFHPYQAI